MIRPESLNLKVVPDSQEVEDVGLRSQPPDLGIPLARLCLASASGIGQIHPHSNKERTLKCKIISDEAILMLRAAV